MSDFELDALPDGPRKEFILRSRELRKQMEKQIDDMRNEMQRLCAHVVTLPFERNNNSECFYCDLCGTRMTPILFEPYWGTEGKYTKEEIEVIRDFMLDMKGKRVKP